MCKAVSGRSFVNFALLTNRRGEPGSSRSGVFYAQKLVAGLRQPLVAEAHQRLNIFKIDFAECFRCHRSATHSRAVCSLSFGDSKP